MDCFALIEGDGTTLVDPVSGRGRLVIKGILWLTASGADERERGLMRTTRCISKLDLRGQSVVGNHAAEKIGRDTANEPSLCAETRHADGDVEAGTSRHGHDGVAPVQRFDGQEINQGIAATQQHRSQLFASTPGVNPIRCIASRLSRSNFRINPWTRRLVRWKSAIPGAVGPLRQPIADIEAIASPIDP